MIKIIGTDHLMSKDAIYGIIKDENPDIIAVELCENRFNLLVKPKLENKEIEREKGNTILDKISESINKKAKAENIEYGGDQINACIFALENNIELKFVDLDIIKTKELMQLIPKDELNKFLLELQKFENQALGEQIKNIDVEQTLIELKTEFPVSFEFLINMRNLVIINNLLKLDRDYPNKNILCILGKGHIKIIEDALK